MKALETVLEEISKYNSPYQRVAIWIDNDRYFDTTPDGARVAIGDLSKLMVKSINDDYATEKWLPIIINCVSA